MLCSLLLDPATPETVFTSFFMKNFSVPCGICYTNFAGSVDVFPLLAKSAPIRMNIEDPLWLSSMAVGAISDAASVRNIIQVKSVKYV